MARRSVSLHAVAGTPAPQVAAAVPVLTRRLERLGVASPDVAAHGRTVRVAGRPDPFALEAAARTDPSALWTVTSTAVGACPPGNGVPSSPAGHRCYQLGERVSGTEWFASATARRRAGLGWTVRIAVDPHAFADFRATVLSHAGQTLALVAGDAVIVAFGVDGSTGLSAEISSPMSEAEAKRAAAALLVTLPLPASFEAPRVPRTSGPVIRGDFWQAALGAHVCGAWLADAPPTAPDSGLHSHGDGLVYVHPFLPDEAGRHATLGLFLSRGHWTATRTRLRLWDAVTHADGDRCPDGRAASVRWWVDGREQRGDPAALRLRNGQVIVLGFDADATPPGEPPQLAALPIPRLEARGAGG
jgi:hypothetical protein